MEDQDQRLGLIGGVRGFRRETVKRPAIGCATRNVLGSLGVLIESQVGCGDPSIVDERLGDRYFLNAAKLKAQRE